MIAIIPARGGSKGLPRKNIRRLCGKPMLAYTIEAGLASTQIDNVFVSTDDEEIADVARQFGALCPFLRPAELATDDAHPIDAFLHMIAGVRREFGRIIPHFAVLQPTSPLLLPDDIDRAIRMFHDKHADSVISYTKEQHPLSWHKYLTTAGRFEHIFGQDLSPKQARRPSYYCTGSILVLRAALLEQRTYYTANSFACILPRSRAVDVDTLEDFEYAGFLLQKRQRCSDEGMVR